MSSVHAKHHITKHGNVSEKTEAHELTFLFTSESVGEGHPGEKNITLINKDFRRS